ncbi:putative bacteriocin export ABC transporter [Clostridium sp.]|uniref:putative bacteriocin export ABC transporter n=1 Tax=Clostridium sp. TaxID=1506 RepID=UPI0026DD12C9|nr:putative bacteriocin export ABC transporter [Clostridium sp.]MDO5040083.1 putative bacteriocin export ABC transporter [Clostridium sp.]
MIQLQNISKSYKDKNIFENFNLSINKGDFISIIGESGSGKTTLINIMGLLEKPTEGNVIINNITNPNNKESLMLQRNSFGYLFQNYALIENETVEKNLKIALKYNKDKNKNKIELINHVLKLVELENYNKKKIYELSGGEQQRISLARIMLKKCEIIFADEPTGNLDKKNRDIVFNILKDLNEKGKTIILVTHDKELSNKCDKTINL